MENVEVVRADKPLPEDIDVVTVLPRPDWWSDEEHSALFDPDVTKERFHVHGFGVELNSPPYWLVKKTGYWQALFGHQRDTYVWKGILEIAMNPGDDAAASRALDALEQEDGAR